MCKSLRWSMAFFLCLFLLLILTPASWADSLQDLQAAAGSGAAEFILTGDTVIPAGVNVDASTTLIRVPAGKTLTVRGKLTVSDFTLSWNEDGESGSLLIPEGGEVHLTQRIGVANVFWDDCLENGSADRFTYDDNAGFELWRWVEEPGDGMLGLARAFADAQNYCAGKPYLHFCADLGFPWTVEQATTIPACVTVNSSEDDIRVTGSLVNNGTISLGSQARVLVYDGGSYSGSGQIVREGQAADVEYFDPSADFAEACSQSYPAPSTYFVPEGSSIVIDEDLTIPANLSVMAIGSGIELEGAALTIDGELICSAFTDNGSVTVGANALLYVERSFDIGTGTLTLSGTLSIEHDAFDPATLQWGQNFFQNEGSLLDVSFNVFTETEMREILFDGTPSFGSGFRRSFWMLSPWTLSENLTLPGETRLCIAYGMGYEGSLLIPAGRILTVSEGAELYARGAGPESQGAVVDVRGALVNNGSIELDWGDTLGDIALSGSGSYSGSGAVTRGGEPYDLAAEHAAYAALAAACAQSYAEPTEYDMEGTHNFTIRDSLTIPENLSVFAIDTTFEVPLAGSLAIAGGGELIAGGLASLGRTTVDGSLHLENDCRVQDNPIVVRGDVVMTLDAWVNLMIFSNASGPDDTAAKFSFERDGALLDIWYDMIDEADVSASLDFPMFHIPHVRETLCLTFPWTLDHDRVLDTDRRLLLHYGGEATGVLTIPAGMTLEIPQGSELFARGRTENEQDPAIVRVEGVLINNGTLTLQYTRAGLAELALINGGVYAGKGTVTRGGEPFAIWNDHREAFLVLPADLETIGSEALAGGAFFSVYIPEGVVSIADDVFGGAERMIVYGVPGSAAERFAAERGFLFAPVASA